MKFVDLPNNLQTISNELETEDENSSKAKRQWENIQPTSIKKKA